MPVLDVVRAWFEPPKNKNPIALVKPSPPILRTITVNGDIRKIVPTNSRRKTVELLLTSGSARIGYDEALTDQSAFYLPTNQIMKISPTAEVYAAANLGSATISISEQF